MQIPMKGLDDALMRPYELLPPRCGRAPYLGTTIRTRRFLLGLPGLAMADTFTTIDHVSIQLWAEARGGAPARVRTPDGSDHVGLLRIAFNTDSAAAFQQIPWDVFFETFDASGLAFVHDGDSESRYFRFVLRGGA
jgi:hypothetical protein